MSIINATQNSIAVFAKENNISIDKLYIDRFWSSLYDDRWVYIDTEIITWIGYTSDKIQEGKKYVLKKLRSDFKQDIDFKLIKLEDVDDCEYIPHIDMDTVTANNLLIVEPDAFKKLLLSMPNSKASQIQNYFITVERLCRKYMQHQLCINNKIIRMPLEANEVVYVISSNANAKMSLYKIGKTKNLKSRLSSLNTSNPDRVNDRLKALMVIKTYDCDSMEKMIHAHLDEYRHSDSKEWFKIDYNKLLTVIKHFRRVAQESINVVNGLDSNQLVVTEPPLLMEVPFQPLSILPEPAVEVSTEIKTFSCDKCKKIYKSKGFYDRHIAFCK
mgnify:CR=1 FL=1